jgi:hypothetical protein
VKQFNNSSNYLLDVAAAALFLRASSLALVDRAKLFDESSLSK